MADSLGSLRSYGTWQHRDFMRKARGLLGSRLGGGGGSSGSNMTQVSGASAKARYGTSGTTITSTGGSAEDNRAWEAKKKHRALYGKYGKGGILREQIEVEKQRKEAEADAAAAKYGQERKDKDRTYGLKKREQDRLDKEAGIEISPGRQYGGGSVVPPTQQSPAGPAQTSPFPGTREERPWSQMPKGSGRITVPEGSANKPTYMPGMDAYGRRTEREVGRTGAAGTYEMNREGSTRFTSPGPRAEGAAIAGGSEQKTTSAQQAAAQAIAQGEKQAAVPGMPSAPTGAGQAALQTAYDMVLGAPVKAIGKKNISAAWDTVADMMYKNPMKTIEQNPELFRAMQGKLPRELEKKIMDKIGKGSKWLSKFVFGEMR